MYVHLNASQQAKAFFKNSKFAIKKDDTHNVVTIVRDDGEELQLWAESDSSVAAGIPGIFVDEKVGLDYYCKKSALLKKLLELYVPGGAVDNHRCSYFICLNIDMITIRQGGFLAGEELKQWIDKLLTGPDGEARTYGEWLDENHPDFVAAQPKVPFGDTHAVDRAMRQGRYEWLQWMIWYWECQGE
jgi:hypothetical protein